MAYIGNTLEIGLTQLQQDRAHFLTDLKKLNDLVTSFDLGGGESAPSATPTEDFGETLQTDTFDANNFKHLLTIDLGSVA